MNPKTRSLRRKLLIGASLGSLVITGGAQAQSQGVFGNRGGGNPADAAVRAAQAQAARAAQSSTASRRAIETFQRAAATRTALSDAQRAARAAAQAAQSNVPNGLGDGGLKAADGVQWIGAKSPSQSQGTDGRTKVDIDQTEQKAILTWDSFNVGKDTDLSFNQGGTDWIALNRVTDAQTDPSKILGSIKAPGSVYLLNRNGVIFGGASQINVHSLVAATASISDATFLSDGIYSQRTTDINGFPILNTSFTGAQGVVKVEAGAQITTNEPNSAVAGGGFVLLMGTRVENAGTIVTNGGQAALAAGDEFFITPGYGTDANRGSSTRGNEVAVRIADGSDSGQVVNSGIIEAAEGDITLAGRNVVQAGVATVTTTVKQRGTIHLLTDLSDAAASVTLTADSVTLALPDLGSDVTATNAQRDQLITESNDRTIAADRSGLNNQATIYDRKDLSRVEITSGGSVNFEGGSTTVATGGQIAVTAKQRVFTGDGATLDVSGAQGVSLAMESNNLKVNVQAFELRDSPLNRENGNLKNNDVWIDVRDLVLLPDGTGGYDGDRYYTPDGLLEVGGHLGNTEHGIGEWTAQGGTIALAGSEIVAQKGSVFNIGGGSLDYAGGYMQSTRLLGADGRLYDIGQAPAGMAFVAVGNAFMRKHDRWGERYAQVYAHPLFSRATSTRWEDGYTVGRDAGALTLSAPTVLFDGEILADVITGDRQTDARPDQPLDPITSTAWRLDGYTLPQNVAPLAGALFVGNAQWDDPNQLQTPVAFDSDTIFGDGPIPSVDATTPLADALANTVNLSSASISKAGLGGLRVVGRSILVESGLTLADGGQLTFQAADIRVEADITAHSGLIALDAYNPRLVEAATSLVIAPDVTLDVRGTWTNLFADPDGDSSGLAYIAGGDIYLRSYAGPLTLSEGSVLDASAGAAVLLDGSQRGAGGGDVTIITVPDVPGTAEPGNRDVTLKGTVRSYGSVGHGGGTLTLSTGQPIAIGGDVLETNGTLQAGEAAPGDVRLLQDLTIHAGETLLVDYQYTKTMALPGESIGGQPVISAANPLTPAVDWYPPKPTAQFASYTLVSSTGERFQVFSNRDAPLVPANTQIVSITSAVYFPATYTVQADVFPSGIAIQPTLSSIKAGNPAPADVIVPAGTVIPRGSVLGETVAIAPMLNISDALFHSGFTQYDVTSQGDLFVAPGATIAAYAPQQRITAAGMSAATGSDPADAMELWLPPEYQENPVDGVLTPRVGASISLAATSLFYTGGSSKPVPLGGTLTIGEGAQLHVDDGQSIALTATSAIRMSGTLEAHGGTVTLATTRADNVNRANDPTVPVFYDPRQSIWLDQGSRIDVSGVAAVAEDQFGDRYGIVRDGGTIAIGGNTAAYVVVRPGAVLDASGTSAELDGARHQPVTIASDGGTIRFASQYGIYLDGDMHADAGGANASGGLLSITLTTPLLSASTGGAMPDFMRRLRTIVIDQNHGQLLPDDTDFGACFTGCWIVGNSNSQTEAANAGKPDLVGQAHIGVDQIMAGGFDSLALKSDDMVLLNGAVSLGLRRNLTIGGVVANIDPNADARLAAAYVNLAQAGGAPAPLGDPLGEQLVFGQLGSGGTGSDVPVGEGTLRIEGALVDIGSAKFGVVGHIGLNNGASQLFSYFAPALVDVVSQGDIRLTGGQLDTFGDLSLTATQVYPTTGAAATLRAGVYFIDNPVLAGNSMAVLRPGSKIAIHGLDGAAPPAPLSVYGTVALGADIVEQDGILRAPLGSIALGFTVGTDITTSAIHLLPGSLTSVSAAGLVIPYGGTQDGLTWDYRGLPEAPGQIAGNKVVNGQNTQYSMGVTLLGALTADKGSTLDLSGGGTPAGMGFISGRGGSVDVLQTALANANPGYAGLSDAGNQVFAIVPAYATSLAPRAMTGSDIPETGRQITVPEGVAGLPAGTYMLLPAEFAMLPGAFRVELGAALRPGSSPMAQLPDGSFSLAVQTGIANTGIRDSLAVSAILTPSKAVRTYSEYNETSFGDFLRNIPAAKQFDYPAAFLPEDGKLLTIALAHPGEDEVAPDIFTFNGTGLFGAAEGGRGGILAVVDSQASGGVSVEILGDGATPTPGWAWLRADDLNAIGATMMSIGTRPVPLSTGRVMTDTGPYDFGTGLTAVAVRSGAVLQAPQVLLATGAAGTITVESGARITTIGMGDPAYDSSMGYIFGGQAPGSYDPSMVIVSNGLIEMVAPATTSSGLIEIADGAEILTEGTFALRVPGSVNLADGARYGARYLSLASSSFNIGEADALGAADDAGLVPAGVSFSQATLERLLQGNSASGAPALERMILTASQSVNFFGGVTLDTTASGGAGVQLVFNSPALYGYGAEGDAATLKAGTIVWNGVADGVPGGVIAGGAGTGHGTLNFVADRIVLGFQDGVLGDDNTTLDRLALGFSAVNLTANDRIVSNNKGTLAVYETQDVYGQPGTGGDLHLAAPLLTGDAGSVMRYTAGGTIDLVTPQGATPAKAGTDALGAEIGFDAASVTIDGTIGLPSGKLTVTADGDIRLGEHSRLDLAGQTVTFFDETRYSWGGDVVLESENGGIAQAAGSTIDLSALYNNAGQLQLTAVNGNVALDGAIDGHARVGEGEQADPELRGGSIDIRALTVSDFAGLNQRLNAAGVNDTRSFVIKSGDLVIGDELQARNITVSADGGSLTINGTIDASGAKPGTIRLSARDDLVLAATAVLDVRGDTLQVDSYGAPIEASNRGSVELTTANGTLTLAPGATIAMASVDGVARGRIDLNVPRLGTDDAAIDASGPVTITGAASIDVNAFRSYTPADGVIDQALMDGIHADSTAYVEAALGNGALMTGKLAGLRGYSAAFHFRPGVALVSADGGDLTVSGDLDLAGYRYRSVNPNTQQTAEYGSGEAGALVVRAANDLDIFGSITDGFGEPRATPDDNGWYLLSGAQGSINFTLPAEFKVPGMITLAAGTTFMNRGVLTFDAPIAQTPIAAGKVIPIAVTVADGSGYTFGTAWTTTAPITLPGGDVIAKGTLLAAGTVLPSGTVLGANTRLPGQVSIAPMIWPKGTSLDAFDPGFSPNFPFIRLSADVTLETGDIIPQNTTVMLAGGQSQVDTRPGGAGRLWAVAPMLPKGSESWSVRLVAGADLGSADTRTLAPKTALAATGRSGNLTLSDRHFGSGSILVQGLDPNNPYYHDFCQAYPSYCETTFSPTSTQSFSVLRTGTGDLDLLAGGSFSEDSLFGVYTAGTPSDPVGGETADGYNEFEQPRSDRVPDEFAGPVGDYRAWYPEHGGDVLLKAQGDVSGYVTAADGNNQRFNSSAVGNWLWRQGRYGAEDGPDIPTAWWINFGTYAWSTASGTSGGILALTGFTGIGTLGGGNLTVAAGGNAGTVQQLGNGMIASQGLNLAVGATGRVTGVDISGSKVTGGTVVQTGGGDLIVRIGGSLNPVTIEQDSNPNPTSDLGGTLTNVRGDIDLLASSIGRTEPVSMVLTTGTAPLDFDPRKPQQDEWVRGYAMGGIVVVPGDGSASLQARGDLVVAGAGNPGTVTQVGGVGIAQYDEDGGVMRPEDQLNTAGFSLWQPDTALTLFAAGGNLTPITSTGTFRVEPTNGNDQSSGQGVYWYPPIFDAVAANGSIHWGPDQQAAVSNLFIGALELAPSPEGRLSFLAGESIIASGVLYNSLTNKTVPYGMPVTASGMAADPDSIPNPFKPYSGPGGVTSLAMFQADTALGELYDGTRAPSLFYAADGDVNRLNFGFINYGLNGNPSYVSAGAVRIRASRDIVDLGTWPAIGCQFVATCSSDFGNYEYGTVGGLIVHNDPTDISVISAGRDIIYGNMNVAGPGNLVVEAGRNIYQAEKGRFTSVGPLFDITPESRNGGASISILTGVGAGGPDYDAFAALYLNPANLAEAGRPLADQPGKVVKTYEAELKTWLEDRFGYEATDTDDALAYFDALAPEQRDVFVRKVYFDELTAGGREYNDADGPRFGSYLRGRDAISMLFPEKDAQGNAISYAGDLTMFGGSGVRTLFGGDVELLVAGGQTLIGVGDVPPPATAGVLSMGSGDIDVYSLGSVLLGQSRVFTTFGGNITIWSAEGDINAGRGAKSTSVFQPPRRVYDLYGNVTLSPPTQNTGAGIATLAPLPEVPAGDVDLIAPLGTIDAGEAGIRVSGDVNLAALQVINAANIQVKGNATGIPLVAAVNTGALTAASSATSAVVAEAVQLAERTRPKPIRDIPSIITSRFLGFGEE